MIDVPKPFPIEFRRDVVAVARRGQAPLSRIAKDFGISESCLHRWLKLAGIEEGTHEDPPFGVDVGSMPIKALAAQIGLFCRSRLGACVFRLLPVWRLPGGVADPWALIAFTAGNAVGWRLGVEASLWLSRVCWTRHAAGAPMRW
jgi:hypothetical protein